MPRRYTGGFLSGTEQVTDANISNGVFTVQEVGALTAAGNFPSGRWTPQNSLRFKRSANSILLRSPSTASNLRTWTWSAWVKRGIIKDTNGDENLWGARSSGSSYTLFAFRNSGSAQPDCVQFQDGASGAQIAPSRAFRDPAAWYHIVLSVDTTQAIAFNRVKIYTNGVLETAFQTATYPAQNSDLQVNTVTPHAVGGDPWDSGVRFDGYMSEVNFVDGQQLGAEYFGFTDAVTGAWVPKRYTGTYGTNGYYLTLNNTFNSTFAADFLLVGGGASGHPDAHGGGGAGGYVEGTAQVAVATPYKITVGAGTASGISTSGNSTYWGSLVALYGGVLANNGGSGGGGGNTDGTNNAGSSIQPANKYGTGYGYAGGNCTSGGGYKGGGGGGAGGAGGNAGSNSTGGSGGSGRASSLTGSSVTYAGGGGGGGYYGGSSGGSSIGGNGGTNSPSVAGTNGATNTGSGGGSGGGGRGLGGSGIAVIKIPNTYAATFSGGVTYTTITSVSGYNIYRITATSTTSETVTFN